jgi:tripartite-type tricarboxylate transporter receptor subunit TctC
VHDFDIPLYLVVPAKTPTEIVQVLERTLEKVAKDPEFISDVKKLYLIPFYIDGQTIMRKMLPGRMQRIKEIMQYAGLLK